MPLAGADSLEDPTPPLLSLRHATVLRGGRPALHDLSFEIREGEHTAILGPNGSGKSSLIRLVTRQDHPLLPDPEAPPIRILGQDRWDLFELRTQLGIVSADLHQAFLRAEAGGAREGLDVVLSGFFASHGRFSHQRVTATMRQRAGAALARVGAAHLAGKPPEAMSTGEARRVLIARALVNDPRALLLDEPTTGLDLAARQAFLDMLQGLAERHKTLLLVTHHIEEVLPQVERVILLKAGRVFRDGPKAEVLTSANLSALYETAVQVQVQLGRYTATCG
ncbi:MAG: ATP-binding cassette domain-containing protein [Holophagaceae bacterium]|nr:ATP-binding cassette domain-containing protein [Holophagaceae bacterium]